MKRVKCANCGMVWDVYTNTCFIQSCPNCKSIAYDVLNEQPSKYNFDKYQEIFGR